MDVTLKFDCFTMSPLAPEAPTGPYMDKKGREREREGDKCEPCTDF